MKKATDNICATCEISQDCCTNLSGLQLSRAEFERNFLRHRDSLIIKEYNGIYKISGRANKCPNWDDNRCAVYETRSIECRLFPYTIGGIMRIGRFVVLTYHHRTRCPQKDRLLASRTVVVNMLKSFAEEAFGHDVRVMIVSDILPLRVVRLLRRLPHKIARTVAGAVHKAGH